jgi:hypothetical protein
MIPEMQAFLDALQLFLGTDFLSQLTSIISFAAGLASGLAFVVASRFRWH